MSHYIREQNIKSQQKWWISAIFQLTDYRLVLVFLHQQSQEKDISILGFWDCYCHQYPYPLVVYDERNSKPYTEITYNHLVNIFYQTIFLLGLVSSNPPMPINKHIHRVFVFSQNPHSRHLQCQLHPTSSISHMKVMRTLLLRVTV